MQPPWRPLSLFACLLLLPLLAQADTIQGRASLSFAEVAGRLGMELSATNQGKNVRLSSPWTTIEAREHRREVVVNGIQVHIGFPLVWLRGQLWLAEADYDASLAPILTPQVFEPNGRVRTIVIDPGHGGRDSGAENTALGLREKSLALDLSKRLKTRLEAAGFRVYLTRESDTFLTHTRRVQIARERGADLFLSVHFNAHGRSSVQGIETFTLTPKGQPSSARSRIVNADRRGSSGNRDDAWNTLAAYHIQQQLVRELKSTDRGVKRARFAVLRELPCPGLLIEGGFISHAREGRNVGSPGYRDRMADAIVRGVLAYRRTLDRLAE